MHFSEVGTTHFRYTELSAMHGANSQHQERKMKTGLRYLALVAVPAAILGAGYHFETLEVILKPVIMILQGFGVFLVLVATLFVIRAGLQAAQWLFDLFTGRLALLERLESSRRKYSKMTASHDEDIRTLRRQIADLQEEVEKLQRRRGRRTNVR